MGFATSECLETQARSFVSPVDIVSYFPQAMLFSLEEYWNFLIGRATLPIQDKDLKTIQVEHLLEYGYCFHPSGDPAGERILIPLELLQPGYGIHIFCQITGDRINFASYSMVEEKQKSSGRSIILRVGSKGRQILEKIGWREHNQVFREFPKNGN